ncbi:MAG: hypothetical protein CFE44_06055 [Burkholderiales bacterium PBB4]|nr:MAG: hypothetical protein CFE44_06055 [Burkholderiales bacterium PBB4]
MNLSPTSAVQTATSAAAASAGDALHLLVLKKALNLQAVGAATLLQALPEPPLATSGSVGTRLNTFA